MIVGVENSDANEYDCPVLVLQETTEIFEEPEATRWEVVAELARNGVPYYDWFGSAVAVSGNTVVVGAKGEEAWEHDHAGAVYVYQDNGNGWEQIARLTAGETAAEDNAYFGYSVAIDEDGDTIVVGAPREGVALEGAVYVFEYVNDNWCLEQRVVPDTPQYFAEFGNDVDISNDVILVGAHKNISPSGGAAYLFQHGGQGWTQKSMLTATDPSSGDYFGCSVALDDHTAVVGAYGDDVDSEGDAGAAYMFELDGQLAVTSTTRLTLGASAVSDDQFGTSVDILGNSVVVGAPGRDDGETNNGAVYLIDKTNQGNGWENNPLDTMSDPEEGQWLGAAVALGDRGVVAGAPHYDSDTTSLIGAAYLFPYNRTPVVEDLTFEVTGASLSETLVGLDPFEGEDVTFVEVADATYGSVTVNADGSFTYTPPGTPPADYFTDTFTYRANDGAVDSNVGTVTLYVGAPQVVDRLVFYNNSYLDGDDPAANEDDDAAIDSSKTALSPGGTPTSANRTGYGSGINGIMIDVFNLADPEEIAADDFAFDVGSGGSWSTAAAPTSISARPSPDTEGADRITIIWADGAIADTWLRVTVEDTLDTGLAADDIFYFGNLRGDAGGDGFVGGDDLDIVRAYWGSSGGMSIGTGDFNLDDFVGGDDLDILRANWGQSLADPEGSKSASAPPSDDLYSAGWSKEVDAIFRRYGFGDNDPKNDLSSEDKLWDDFVDELFDAIEKELASTLGPTLKENLLVASQN